MDPYIPSSLTLRKTAAIIEGLTRSILKDIDKVEKFVRSSQTVYWLRFEMKIKDPAIRGKVKELVESKTPHKIRWLSDNEIEIKFAHKDA